MNERPLLLPDLRRRAGEPERMDLPDSDQCKLENTLARFEIINRTLTRVRWLLRRYVVNAMRRRPDRQYHLVDLGAGACETAFWLLNGCREEKLKLKITAIDHDPGVVRYARSMRGSVPGLNILRRDILDLDDLGPIDFIFANHLLHHLDDARIVELLKYFRRFKGATILINDIERNRINYMVYYFISLLFSRDSFARYDGLLSIRKGFRTRELRQIMNSAFPRRSPYQIKKIPPGRILLVRQP